MFTCFGMDCHRMLFYVSLIFGCWSWNDDNRIRLIISNTYFTIFINFLYIYLFGLLQVIMVVTRHSRSFILSVTTRKVGAKKCEAKYLPTHMWYNSCSESSNRSTREKVRPYYRPWVINDDSKPYKKNIITLFKITSIMYCSLLLKRTRQGIHQHLLAIFCKIAMILLC